MYILSFWRTYCCPGQAVSDETEDSKTAATSTQRILAIKALQTVALRILLSHHNIRIISHSAIVYSRRPSLQTSIVTLQATV